MDIQNMELRKFVAPELVFGLDARFLAGRYAKNFGARKVLIVSDPGIIAAGWLNEIILILEGDSDKRFRTHVTESSGFQRSRLFPCRSASGRAVPDDLLAWTFHLLSAESKPMKRGFP